MLPKFLKQFAKTKGVKNIQLLKTTINNPYDCPITLPCFIIDKDKNMKVICQQS